MVQQATAGAKKKKKVRHPSAEKRARQSIRREAVNRARRSRMRTAVKNVELALAAGDKAAAQAALKQAQPELDHAVSIGVLKRTTASRKLSRLSAQVSAASAHLGSLSAIK